MRGFRAGSDIFGAVAETVSRHPNQAPYQLGHTRKYFGALHLDIENVLYITFMEKASVFPVGGESRHPGGVALRGVGVSSAAG